MMFDEQKRLDTPANEPEKEDTPQPESTDDSAADRDETPEQRDRRMGTGGIAAIAGSAGAGLGAGAGIGAVGAHEAIDRLLDDEDDEDEDSAADLDVFNGEAAPASETTEAEEQLPTDVAGAARIVGEAPPAPDRSSGRGTDDAVIITSEPPGAPAGGVGSGVRGPDFGSPFGGGAPNPDIAVDGPDAPSAPDFPDFPDAPVFDAPDAPSAPPPPSSFAPPPQNFGGPSADAPPPPPQTAPPAGIDSPPDTPAPAAPAPPAAGPGETPASEVPVATPPEPADQPAADVPVDAEPPAPPSAEAPVFTERPSTPSEEPEAPVDVPSAEPGGDASDIDVPEASESPGSSGSYSGGPGDAPGTSPPPGPGHDTQPGDYPPSHEDQGQHITYPIVVHWDADHGEWADVQVQTDEGNIYQLRYYTNGNVYLVDSHGNLHGIDGEHLPQLLYVADDGTAYFSGEHHGQDDPVYFKVDTYGGITWINYDDVPGYEDQEPPVEDDYPPEDEYDYAYDPDWIHRFPGNKGYDHPQILYGEPTDVINNANGTTTYVYGDGMATIIRDEHGNEIITWWSDAEDGYALYKVQVSPDGHGNYEVDIIAYPVDEVDALIGYMDYGLQDPDVEYGTDAAEEYINDQFILRTYEDPDNPGYFITKRMYRDGSGKIEFTFEYENYFVIFEGGQLTYTPLDEVPVDEPVEEEQEAILPDETPEYFEYGGIQFDNPDAQGYELINVNGNLYEYQHPETGEYISVLDNGDGTYTVWVRGDEQPGNFQMEFTVDANGNYQGTGGEWYDEYNAQNPPDEVYEGEYQADWANHYDPQFGFEHPYLLYGQPDEPGPYQPSNVHVFGGGQAMVIVNPDGSETISWYADGTYGDGYVAYSATVSNQGGDWQTDSVALPVDLIPVFGTVNVEGIPYLDPAQEYGFDHPGYTQEVLPDIVFQTWQLDDGTVIRKSWWRDGSHKVTWQHGDEVVITYDPAVDPNPVGVPGDGFPGDIAGEQDDQPEDEPDDDGVPAPQLPPGTPEAFEFGDRSYENPLDWGDPFDVITYDHGNHITYWFEHPETGERALVNVRTDGSALIGWNYTGGTPEIIMEISIDANGNFTGVEAVGGTYWHEYNDQDDEPVQNLEPVEDEQVDVLPEGTPEYFEYGGQQFDNPEAQGYNLINVNGNVYEYQHPETGEYISVLINDNGGYTVWIRGDEQPGNFEMEFVVDANGNYQGSGGTWYEEYNAAQEQPEESVQEEEAGVLPDAAPAGFEYGGQQYDNPETQGYTLINVNGNLYEYQHPETGEYIAVLVNDDGSHTVWVRGDQPAGSFEMEFRVYPDGSYDATGGAWYEEYNLQQAEEEQEEEAAPPQEPQEDLLPPWLPASFSYDGTTWPSPVTADFAHFLSHEGNEYFANGQYNVLVFDRGDGSAVIMIDELNAGPGWDMAFNVYSDGSYVPLDEYVAEEEPLEFETTSAEVPQEDPVDETAADEQAEADEAAETDTDGTDLDLAGTDDPATTDSGNDLPPVEHQSLDEDDTMMDADEDVDDGL